MSRTKTAHNEEDKEAMCQTDVPRVSVVMPTYNVAAYVEEAVVSILKQTFTDFEFIIVDDGSTDETWPILKRLAAQDRRICLERNPTHPGQLYSRNRGLQLARADLIAIMDADDISMPERFEKQVAYLDAHPEVGAVGGAIRQIFGQTLGRVMRCPMTPGLIAWTMCFNIPSWHASCMVRRSVLLAVGGYDESFVVSGDHDLWLRMSHHTYFGNVPDVVLYYRRHASSTTYRHSERQLCNTTAIVQRALAGVLGVQLSAPEVRRLAWGMYSPEVNTDRAVALLYEVANYIEDKYGLTPEEWREIQHDIVRRVLLVLKYKPDVVTAAESLAYAFRIDARYAAIRLGTGLLNGVRTRMGMLPLGC